VRASGNRCHLGSSTLLVIIRGDDHGGAGEPTVHTSFNGCRHRGSRVCLEPQGYAKRLVWHTTSASTARDVGYDPANVSWVWSVTGGQDYVLCENNQLGVNSTRYEPGPYATIERGPDRFIEWYFERMRETT